jgi:hypothetical protein
MDMVRFLTERGLSLDSSMAAVARKGDLRVARFLWENGALKNKESLLNTLLIPHPDT